MNVCIIGSQRERLGHPAFIQHLPRILYAQLKFSFEINEVRIYYTKAEFHVYSKVITSVSKESQRYLIRSSLDSIGYP